MSRRDWMLWCMVTSRMALFSGKGWEWHPVTWIAVPEAPSESFVVQPLSDLHLAVLEQAQVIALLAFWRQPIAALDPIAHGDLQCFGLRGGWQGFTKARRAPVASLISRNVAEHRGAAAAMHAVAARLALGQVHLVSVIRRPWIRRSLLAHECLR